MKQENKPEVNVSTNTDLFNLILVSYGLSRFETQATSIIGLLKTDKNTNQLQKQAVPGKGQKIPREAVIAV